jgi:hypothetical protein
MRLGTVFLAFVVGCLSLIAAGARADDIFLPPWDRPTDPGSGDPADPNCHFKTYQEFGLSAAPDARYGGDFWCTDPDVGINARGAGRTQYYWEGQDEPPMLWNDDLLGRQGVFSSVEAIDFFVPNFPEDPDRQKLIWIQITYYSDAVQGAVPNDAWASPNWPENTEEFLDLYSHGDGWWTQVIYIKMKENPWDEWCTVTFDGQGIVDQIVVDTWCFVPEPSALGLLASGALGLFGLLRGKKK